MDADVVLGFFGGRGREIGGGRGGFCGGRDRIDKVINGLNIRNTNRFYTNKEWTKLPFWATRLLQ